MGETSLKNRLGEIRLMIFDIDGVLVDVTDSYRLAIKKTAEHYSGLDITFGDIQQLKNESGFNNDWDLTEELLKRKGFVIEKHKIIETFQQFYWGHEGDGLIQNESWLMDKSLLLKLSQKYNF